MATRKQTPPQEGDALKHESNGAASKAPAAEKALDILEFMAHTATPQTQSQIAAGLGRSIHEVYRIIQVLERRGYLERDSITERYVVSQKLFTLAHATPRILNLSEAAIEPMRKLVDEIGQSCHVAVLNEAQISIVCQVDSPLSMHYGVSLGARFPAHQTSSGLVLMASLSPEIKARTLDLVKSQLGQDESMNEVLKNLGMVERNGHDVRPSLVVDGVMNITFPIFDENAHTRAALTTPVLQMKGMATIEKTVGATAAAAEEISRRMGYRGRKA